MKRTIRDATTEASRYSGHAALKAHVPAFVNASNFAKHLKALRWRTSFQGTCDAWQRDPAPFKSNPHHFIPGPHTSDESVSGLG